MVYATDGKSFQIKQYFKQQNTWRHQTFLTTTLKHTVISLEFDDPYLLVPIYPIHWLYYQKFGGGGPGI